MSPKNKVKKPNEDELSESNSDSDSNASDDDAYTGNEVFFFVFACI